MRSALVLLTLACLAAARGAEEQSHGLLFERAVVDHMLHRAYTEEWDLPAAGNLFHPGTPASVKFIRWGNAVYFGDALRQVSLTQRWDLIIGFYEPSRTEKTARLQALHLIEVDPAVWRRAWGSVTPEDVTRLIALAKEPDLAAARRDAEAEAARLRARTGGMDLNPKINADQRRVQCSMDFATFHRLFLGEETPRPQEVIQLAGRPFPRLIRLGERSQREPAAP